jgi:hypothetical protein
MDEKQIQVYVTVDANGEITSAQIGEKIIPAEPCDFFFLVSEDVGASVAADVTQYKVEIVGMKPALVLKENN